MKIFLNAGHSIQETWDKERKEDKMNVMLRDALTKMLRSHGFDVSEVPDNLGLGDSINWVNQRANVIKDIAVSIHFNAHSNPNVGGTEVFYYAKRNTRQRASILSERVSKALGIRNRGAKPDTQSFVGTLGWLRAIFCPSFLIEVCFLTSREDMSKYNLESAVQGIFDGIQAISNTDEEIKRLQSRYVGLLKRIEELMRLILSYIERSLRK